VVSAQYYRVWQAYKNEDQQEVWQDSRTFLYFLPN